MTPPQDDEGAILAVRAAGGDAEAFDRLVTPQTTRLLLLLRRRGGRALGGDCDAEDLLQATLVRAWRLIPGLEWRGPHAFYGWLAAIAEGVVGDRVKYVAAGKRGPVRHLESLAPGPAGAADGSGTRPAPFEPADTATSISRSVARREDYARLARALGALEPEDREVVELHLLEAKTIREVAQEIGLSRSGAWERLDRAMGRLKSLLTA
ncbi:MAG: sigma-70 family RNA polymerase sigma factor [Planctomycetales bacterium]|nr:sigma-70 family RNA polymerase sigma factor [Planctomycetales bacterium]